jgi:hypothetical protein
MGFLTRKSTPYYKEFPARKSLISDIPARIPGWCGGMGHIVTFLAVYKGGDDIITIKYRFFRTQ